jgi:hypothetical protein
MKILITENKRYQLAYKMLDDELSQLTRKDINLNKESVLRDWQVLFINNNGDILMRWNEKYGTLYVSEELIIPLKVLSFGEREENRLVTWWFTNRVSIDPEEVFIVSPGTLNWEDMGLQGLMGEF